MKEAIKNYIASGRYVTPKKLFKAFFTVRTILLLLWTVLTIYVMNIFNAFAYSRMPTREALPDIVANGCKNCAYLRGSKTYMSLQPADMLSVVLTVSSILVTILRWDIINVPKLAYVYNVSLIVRILFFTVTGLPPACIGYPNCPCATIPYSTISRSFSLPKIAFVYTFALGLFLGNIPQCGDLAMSGHTIYLWVLALYVIDALDQIFIGKILVLIKSVIYFLLLFITTTIILIRNHYTIDILFATVFVNMIWQLYSWMAILIHINHYSFRKSLNGKIIEWFEQKADDDDSSYGYDSDALI